MRVKSTLNNVRNHLIGSSPKQNRIWKIEKRKRWKIALFKTHVIRRILFTWWFLLSYRRWHATSLHVCSKPMERSLSMSVCSWTSNSLLICREKLFSVFFFFLLLILFHTTTKSVSSCSFSMCVITTGFHRISPDSKGI